MITAKLQGRRLALTVETEPDEPAIAPVLVDPVSARVGRELSSRYLLTVEGLLADSGQIGADMVRAIGAENAARIDDELSQAEAELMLQAAFFWQTVGGLDAVRALLEVDADGVQGGDLARGKALAAVRLRAVPLLSQIRRDLESARLTHQAATPDTDTPPGGATSDGEPNGSPSSEPPTPSTSTSPPPSSPASSGSD